MPPRSATGSNSAPLDRRHSTEYLPHAAATVSSERRTALTSMTADMAAKALPNKGLAC